MDKVYIVNDLGSKYWGVQTFNPEKGHHTYEIVFETLEGAEAYCREKGYNYTIDRWEDAFKVERAYSTHSEADRLEYLYEVAP